MKIRIEPVKAPPQQPAATPPSGRRETRGVTAPRPVVVAI
jgi:hypothetical protein